MQIKGEQELPCLLCRFASCWGSRGEQAPEVEGWVVSWNRADQNLISMDLPPHGQDGEWGVSKQKGKEQIGERRRQGVGALQPWGCSHRAASYKKYDDKDMWQDTEMHNLQLGNVFTS